MNDFDSLSTEERQKIIDKAIERFNDFTEVTKTKILDLCGKDMGVVMEVMVSMEISYREVLAILVRKFGNSEEAVFKAIQIRKIGEDIYINQGR